MQNYKLRLAAQKPNNSAEQQNATNLWRLIRAQDYSQHYDVIWFKSTSERNFEKNI